MPSGRGSAELQRVIEQDVQTLKNYEVRMTFTGIPTGTSVKREGPIQRNDGAPVPAQVAQSSQRTRFNHIRQHCDPHIVAFSS